MPDTPETEEIFLMRRLHESLESARTASDPRLARSYKGFAKQYQDAVDQLRMRDLRPPMQPARAPTAGLTDVQS